ncbi:MAG: hypothetical protein R3C16_10105 [Hyphomonadaceae bacterium]
MSQPAATTADSPRAAPIALWRAMGAFITLLFNLFGAPEEIAAKGVLMARPRALMLTWLRAGEAMLRRLLLIEAAACAKPDLRTRLEPKRTRARRERAFQADAPERWRVSFRCFMPLDGQRPRPHALSATARRFAGEDAGAPRFPSAWPIAERFEALLRVYNDPAPRAARLARRLHAAPRRAQELWRAPPGADALCGAEVFAEIAAAAAPAAARFNSS